MSLTRALLSCTFAVAPTLAAQQPAPPDSSAKPVILVPDAVWDGVVDVPHRGWVVQVRGSTIESVGPIEHVAGDGATRVDLKGSTLIPGLIEGHSHLFLHPYSETLWDDQVLKEPLAIRMARAVAAAAVTLRAGITSERDPTCSFVAPSTRASSPDRASSP